MKKISLLLLCLFLATGAFTSCNNLALENEAEYLWQEAFAEILRHYHTNVPPPEDWLNWHFFLHDVDKDGIPELFIVYLAAGIWSTAIYAFADGAITPIEGSFFAYWGIYPPTSRPGIIIQAYGLTDLMVVDDGKLTVELALSQPFFDTDEQLWHINGVEVTQEEFAETFNSLMPEGMSEGGANIFPTVITEYAIQNIIR